MANNEDILKEADYYLNNDVTLEQASTDLGISKRTLQLHMKKLESIAPDKFKLVQDKKENNIRQGRVVGGTLGKRSANWTIEEALNIAKTMVDKDLTYEQAEKELGIPHTTLHEMMHKGVDDDKTTSLLYAIATAHKKGMTFEEFKRTYYREHVSIDQISDDMDNQVNKGKK